VAGGGGGGGAGDSAGDSGSGGAGGGADGTGGAGGALGSGFSLQWYGGSGGSAGTAAAGGAGGDGGGYLFLGRFEECSLSSGATGQSGSLGQGAGEGTDTAGGGGGGGYYGGGEGGQGAYDSCGDSAGNGGGGGGASFTGGPGVSGASVNDSPSALASLEGNGEVIVTYANPLTVSGPPSDATAQGGGVTVNTDGSFTYSPPSGFAGTDSFPFTITDAAGNYSTGTATRAAVRPRSRPA
jgi:hypothetical protein